MEENRCPYIYDDRNHLILLQLSDWSVNSWTKISMNIAHFARIHKLLQNYSEIVKWPCFDNITPFVLCFVFKSNTFSYDCVVVANTWFFLSQCGPVPSYNVRDRGQQ